MSIYLGAKEIESLWLGDKEVETIWMGTDQIYSKGSVPRIELINTMDEPTFSLIMPPPSSVYEGTIRKYGPLVIGDILVYGIVELFYPAHYQSQSDLYKHYKTYGYIKAFDMKTGNLIATSPVTTYSETAARVSLFYANNKVYMCALVDDNTPYMLPQNVLDTTSGVHLVVNEYTIGSNSITKNELINTQVRSTTSHSFGGTDLFIEASMVKVGNYLVYGGRYFGAYLSYYYYACDGAFDLSTGQALYGPREFTFNIQSVTPPSSGFMLPLAELPESGYFTGRRRGSHEVENNAVFMLSSSGYTQISYSVPQYNYSKVFNNSNYIRSTTDTVSINGTTWNASQVGNVDGTFHLRYTLNTSQQDFGWHFDAEDVAGIEGFVPTEPSENLSDYGITYSGIPTTGETITVTRASNSVTVTTTINKVTVYQSTFNTTTHTFNAETSVAIPLNVYEGKPTAYALVAHGNYITLAHKEGSTWYINLYYINWQTMQAKLQKKYLTSDGTNLSFTDYRVFNDGDFNLIAYKNIS